MSQPVNCTPSELATFLQALAEGSSPTSSSDTDRFSPSNGRSTANKCSDRESKTDASLGSRSSETCGRLTEHRGGDSAIASLADSLAPMLALPETVPAWMGMSRVFGQNKRVSLARWDRDMFSWRTHQCSLLAAGYESLETLPEWGMSVGGELYRVPTPDFLNRETEFGLLPTLCASECKDRAKASVLARLNRGGRVSRMLCSAQIPDCQEHVGLNPCFAEWMQGFPIGWTALKPLETDKFQSWLHSHSESSPPPNPS